MSGEWIDAHLDSIPIWRMQAAPGHGEKSSHPVNRRGSRLKAAERWLLPWVLLMVAGYYGAFGAIGLVIAVALFGLQWTFYRINVVRAGGRSP